MSMLQTTQELMNFMAECPTAYHASHKLSALFQRAGFIHLKPGDEWELKEGQGYFTSVNDTAVFAFIANPSATHFSLVGSHTDSPALKLKPQGEESRAGHLLLKCEPYGGPILHSWFNRDLGLAGRVVSEDNQQNLKTHLMILDDQTMTLAEPAIHLNREVNEKGWPINKQKHLNVIAGLSDSIEKPLIQSLIQGKLPKGETLLSFDLYFYPLEKPSTSHTDNELIFSYRIDNLASVAASASALMQTKKINTCLPIAIFFDSEEIGSSTFSGANSGIWPELIKSLKKAHQFSDSLWRKICSESLILSADGAHALHPSHLDAFDPMHTPIMGQGIAVKYNTQGRYSTEGIGYAKLKQIAKRAGVHLQNFLMRSDKPCGSTIGPLFSTLSGLRSVDIGIAQHSMHSAREVMASSDYKDLVQLLIESYRS